MSEAKHTPGPWIAGKPFKHLQNTIIPIECSTAKCDLCGKSDGTYLVALTFKNSLPAIAQLPNARLMAAAPDLLKALKEIVAISDRQHDSWIKARAAIAKAEGRS